MKRPNSCVNLKKAIERLPAAGQDAVRLGRALANVVLGQMLPDGVVKGGSALLFRYGVDSIAGFYVTDRELTRALAAQAAHREIFRGGKRIVFSR